MFHTGQEMGQGLTTKCAMTISMRLGVPLDKIYVHGTNTSVVPNDTVSGGSTTSEALCHATDLACDELLERLEARHGFKTWFYIRTYHEHPE